MKDIELIHGDCLEKMKDIPDGSVDCIITDPPYGTTACKWDSVIPFEPMWEQLKRIIKPNGAICLFGSEPFSTKLRMSNFDMFRYDLYWVKSKAGLYQHAKNRPMKAIETISVFSKSKWGHTSQLKEKRMKYYPQGIVSKGTKIVRDNYNSKKLTGGGIPKQVGKEYEAFNGFPNDVLYYNSIIGKNAIHPTQKPVDLLEYIVKTYTQEYETILDFTMGSGSTMVACVNTNRRGIGIELDENYFNIATKRINDAIKEKSQRLS